MREDREGEDRAGMGENGENREKKGKRCGILAFWLFIISFAIGMTSVGLCDYMADNAFYTKDSYSVVEQALIDRAMTKIRVVRDYINRGDLELAKEYCNSGNFIVEIWRCGQQDGNDTCIWSSFDGEQVKTNSGGYDVHAMEVLTFYNPNLSAITHQLFSLGEEYAFYIYVDLDFPLNDDLKLVGTNVRMLYRMRYWLLCAAVICLPLCVSSFVILMRGAGHRKGREGIVPGALTNLHFDVLTLLFAGGMAACCYYIGKNTYYRYTDVFVYAIPVLLVGGALAAALCALYFTDLAIRIKQGGVLRRTYVFVLARGIRRGAAWVVQTVPTVAITVVIFMALCLLELILGGYMLEYVAYSARPERQMQQMALMWGAEKVVLFGVVLYVAYICKRLLKASHALAQGQEDFRVDTAGMFGDFKKHGENLNSIGQGISRAVAEQMKSERLKTELITNVSHDLKTPLTSIINYAELICGEKTENGKIEEYAEVLFRQSGRLKRLLEDLIEASKVTAGSIEVKLEPCEAGVLLTQAVGEYQHRMEEKGLELVVRQPEEPVEIMADGRHLWRVFDNLLNNICKYSREYSRVFLSIEVKEGKALIIFRNMSKYMLDVPSEELSERFVRGDKSRHMEGSGLGLSIAGSLIELQGGRMEIITDGDLFKVILSFGLLA